MHLFGYIRCVFQGNWGRFPYSQKYTLISERTISLRIREPSPVSLQFYAFFKLSGIIYDEKTEPWLVQEDGSFSGAQLMHTLYKGYERLFNSLVSEEAE